MCECKDSLVGSKVQITTFAMPVKSVPVYMIAIDAEQEDGNDAVLLFLFWSGRACGISKCQIYRLVWWSACWEYLRLEKLLRYR